jgi:hypothetical protein
MYQVYAVTIGRYPTPRGKGLTRFGRLARRFERESWPCSRRSTFYVSTRRSESNVRSEEFSRISGDVMPIDR